MFNLLDWSQVETFSEPVHTAFSVFPDFTERNPNFREFMPAQQIPVEEFSSTGRLANKPCTMAACDGKNMSGVEVPQESNCISAAEKVLSNNLRMAFSVISALLCV